MILEFKAIGQQLFYIYGQKPVADSENYLYAHFTLPTDYVLPISVHFKIIEDGVEKGESISLDETMTCQVPNVYVKKGTLYVSLSSRTSKYVTTTSAPVTIYGSGVPTNLLPLPDGTVNEYSDFAAKYQEIIEKTVLETAYAPRLTTAETLLAQKATQVYVDTKIGNMGNTKTFKGICLFASLPVTGAVIDDYWYVSDQDTNFCWNGSLWLNIGNNLKIGEGTIAPESTDFFTIVKSINLVNTAIMTNGQYISYNEGTLHTSAEFGYSAYINVKASTIYQLFFASDYHIAFFDSSKVFISGILGNTSIYSFTTPTNCAYIIISSRLTRYNTLQISEGTVKLNVYTPYYVTKKISNNYIENPYVGNVYSEIVVDKNGKGDYTTISEAVINAISGSTILVMPGEYNESVSAWGKEISIVGVDKHKCILYNVNGNYNTPPLEIGAGHVANMTIYSKDDGVTTPTEGTYSYGVHIEDNYSQNKSLEFFNCDLKSDWNYGVGMGTRGGMKAIFRLCNLIGKDKGGGLFFHDGAVADYAGAADVTLDRCNLTGEQSSYSLKIASQKTVGNTTYLHFINTMVYSKLTGKSCIYTYNADATVGTDFRNMSQFFLSGESYGNNLTTLNT